MTETATCLDASWSVGILPRATPEAPALPESLMQVKPFAVPIV
jgi:hypothetical protein